MLHIFARTELTAMLFVLLAFQQGCHKLVLLTQGILFCATRKYYTANLVQSKTSKASSANCFSTVRSWSQSKEASLESVEDAIYV